jgi:hypothetical protein
MALGEQGKTTFGVERYAFQLRMENEKKKQKQRWRRRSQEVLSETTAAIYTCKTTYRFSIVFVVVDGGGAGDRGCHFFRLALSE